MVSNARSEARSLPQLLEEGVVTIGFRWGADAWQAYNFRWADITARDSRSWEFSHRLRSGLLYVVRLELDEAYQVWRRRDTLLNETHSPIDAELPAQTLGFRDEHISVSCQSSGWCRESQPVRLSLSGAETTIGSRGRSCSGYTPYFSVRSPSFGEISVNLLPCGDWRAVFRTHSSPELLEVAIDRSADMRTVRVPAGGAFDSGLDSLLQCSVENAAALVGADLQRYALERLQRRGGRPVPIAYNTWFDRFYRLSVPRLFEQIDATAEVGCEAFVIDAGWYGTTGGDWTNLVGDWQENPSVFDDVKLADVAARVRSSGMMFGLWMEPERAHPGAPVVRDQPGWFIPIPPDGRFCYPDLEQPRVRDWMRSEMMRLVEQYQLGWLKLDCNTDFGPDPSGAGHHDRLRHLYDIVDSVAARFPELYIEGCASGGLRNDLVTTSHFSTHFLSDSVDPIDVLRITMSNHVRLPPLQMEKWAVIYPAGSGFTPYGRDPGDTDDLVLCSMNAKAEVLRTYHLDLALRACMTGPLGLGGNIAGLSSELRSQLARHLRFYKRHRDLIASAVILPLTAPEPISKRDGIAIAQLSGPGFDRNIVFIYNLGTRAATVTVRLVGLRPDHNYQILDEDGGEIAASETGLRLVRRGVSVECEGGRSRAVIVG